MRCVRTIPTRPRAAAPSIISRRALPCLLGGLRACDSGKTFGAHELGIREYPRFEGVSDRADMAIVYAIESLDGTRGSSADAFCVYSTPS